MAHVSFIHYPNAASLALNTSLALSLVARHRNAGRCRRSSCEVASAEENTVKQDARYISGAPRRRPRSCPLPEQVLDERDETPLKGV